MCAPVTDAAIVGGGGGGGGGGNDDDGGDGGDDDGGAIVTKPKPKRKSNAEIKRERETTTTSFAIEQRFFDLHDTVEVVAGWDEAGRGCLYGPLVSVCVGVRRGAPLIMNVRDSKKYANPPKVRRYVAAPLPPTMGGGGDNDADAGSETKARTRGSGSSRCGEGENEPEEMELEGERERVCDQLMRAEGHSYHVAIREVADIHRLNILGALLDSQCEAVFGVVPLPDIVLIDGDTIAPALEGHERMHVQYEIGGDACRYSIAAASVIAKVTRDRIVRQLALQHPGYGLMRHKGYGTPQHMAALLARGATAMHRMNFDPMKSAIALGHSPFEPGTLVKVDKPKGRGAYRRHKKSSTSESKTARTSSFPSSSSSRFFAS